jgi:poly-gamma-glutamate synthesis protein (capsule biosynthesis protein)
MSKKYLLFLFLLGFLFVTTFNFYFDKIQASAPVKEELVKNDEKSLEFVKLSKDTQLPLKQTISFVGDVMLARHVEYLLNEYGSDYPYRNLNFINKETDYLVGNFESSVPYKHKKTPNFNFQFSVNKKFLPNLKEVGFTHFSLANNHAFDYGREGYENTKTSFSDIDIHTLGHPTILSTSSVSFIELPNYRVAIIGIHNLFVVPSDNDIDKVFNWAKLNSDVQIVYIHWGVEYILNQSEEQRLFANKLIDAGADLIIGHHPHVVQGIEKIRGVPVFYSLGNFIFDQYFSNEVREGLMVSLVDEGDLNLLITPVSSKNTLAQPELMSHSDSEIFLNNLSKRSSSDLKNEILNKKILLNTKLATSSETAIIAE